MARRSVETQTMGALHRRTWSNWYLLSGISLLSTIGFASTLYLLLRGRIDSPWPWVNTDLVLIVGLAVAVGLYILYLTGQQRRLAAISGELQRLELERAHRMQQQHDRLMALLNVSRIMGSETNTQAVFDGITKTCKEIFDCDRVSLMLVDGQKQELVVQSATGNDDMQKTLGSRDPIGHGIAGRVAQQGLPRILGPEDMPDFPATKNEGRPLAEAMIVPIFVRDELVGVLNVGSTAPKVHFDDEDLKALQVFAENAGSVIRHAEQAEWMRSTIRALQAARTPAAPNREKVTP
jgi:transcriptional regulator with GAF, ATPase, and Fis domain